MACAFSQCQVDSKGLDKGAAPLRRAHQATLAQMGKGATNGVSVDAKLLGQNVFGWQTFTGRVLALPNSIGQLMGNA